MKQTVHKPVTLGWLTQKVLELLEDTDLENAANESRWIVSETVHCSVSDLIVHRDRVVTSELCDRVLERARRRHSGEPLAYILENIDFRGLSFFVDQRVLIPRPETEGLVQLVVERIEQDRPTRCLEVGVGSGCIAISILHECPNATFVGTDISSDALGVCRVNAEALGVDTRLSLIQCPEMSQVERQKFSWIVSNPPYIAYDDDRVEENVRSWEPEVALFAARKGLDIIEKIVEDARELLEPDGRLLLEHGDTQGPEVRRMCVNVGMSTRAHLDCFGRSRFVEAWFDFDGA